MADKVKPADDPAIKAAVGYGFDASLRKGTQAGLAAMRGSNEYQKLDSKSKDFADEMFKRRIESDSNLKQFRGVGDEKVSVYRKAAKEKPARVIDYKKEFGPTEKPKTQSTSKQVSSAPPAPIRKAMGGTYNKAASVASQSKTANLQKEMAAGARKVASAPAAPIRKAMGMGSAPKTIGTGPGQMLNYGALAAKKKQ